MQLPIRQKTHLPGLCAALKRKGKGDDVTEEDMGAVVHAHNSAF